MQGFIFVLDENNRAHFINVLHIVTLSGKDKGESTEMLLITGKIFTTNRPIEEVVRLIENSNNAIS